MCFNNNLGMNSQSKIEWLTEKAAQVYTSLSRTRLKTARKENKLSYRILDGSTILYKASDLDKYIMNNSAFFPAIE